jgi:hypothetical protein
VAIAGTLASSPPPAIAPSLAAVAPSPSTVAVAVADADPVLHVDAPSGPGAVITTPGLRVRGSRTGPSGPVRITLESSGSKLIASETIPANGAGGAFAVDFPLSNPRPGGTMVVQVVAFTSHGIPLEVVRIPIEIGAILEGAPRNVGRTGDGPIGEDGILGGIVFGNAWDPEALGEPATP